MKSFVILPVFLASCLAHPTRRTEAPAKPNVTDVDILQFALTLEHLESTFYREGLANYTWEQFKGAGYGEKLYSNLKEVAFDESTHVSFLTTALKGLNATPVEECTYDFGVTDVHGFLALAAVLEGVGTSAYLGAAAAILDKSVLTAAGSILTVEARHSSYLRSQNQQAPIPQPFDAPLSLNEVFTLAAPFIKSCPQANAALPVKAFPALTLESECGSVAKNQAIKLKSKDQITTGKDVALYAAWISASGPTFTATTIANGNEFTTTVPTGFHGQSYVVITKESGCATDDCVVAGPAIVEVQGAAGDD